MGAPDRCFQPSGLALLGRMPSPSLCSLGRPVEPVPAKAGNPLRKSSQSRHPSLPRRRLRYRHCQNPITEATDFRPHRQAPPEGGPSRSGMSATCHDISRMKDTSRRSSPTNARNSAAPHPIANSPPAFDPRPDLIAAPGPILCALFPSLHRKSGFPALAPPRPSL